MEQKKKRIPTMCINCSTICGLLAHVENGKVIKLEGNPNDPNSRGHICAKGHAARNMLYDPSRILHPLKRVGKRGEGKWKRISWEEAIEEVVSHLKPLRAKGKPEQLVLQYGRDCTNGILDRFTDAFGTPNKVGHRGLCSLNKRMAIKATIGDTDWDTNDVAHTRYILNFGSNLYEAHQGHVPFLQRVVEGRIENGAKLVTFDVRLSNTAARSDEWVPIFPGTDGLVALAMGHVIMEEGLYDKVFLDTWTNYSSKELKKYLEQFTPEQAAKESGVPVSTIRRIAIEFAKASPRCTTVSNRGSQAHSNGFHNERAIILLNAIVGNVGKKGGWCYIAGKLDDSVVPQPKPSPPKPSVKTELSHPSAYPFVNKIYPRAVSSTIYPYIAESKVQVGALMTYYVNAPMSWPEGSTTVKEIYLDEEKIPFHVAIDAFYSESAHLADIILPDATFLEKWDLDARNSYELIPYVGLRQPVVQPRGQSRDIRDILKEIAHGIGDGMDAYFQYCSAEEYIHEWAKSVPGGVQSLKENGFYWDSSKQPNYEPFLQVLPKSKWKDALIEKDTGIIKTRDGVSIGILLNGKAYRGFATETRKFQIYLPDLERFNQNHEMEADPLPTYVPIKNRELKENEFILTTFKWNVHTQSRTMNQKWLAEIVHDNPMWINPATAASFHIKDGDIVEVSSNIAKMNIKVHLTEGIHPKVVAISASMGHFKYGPIASGQDIDKGAQEGVNPKYDDNDINDNKWWDEIGYNPNPLIPSKTDPVGGGQSWNDTIVTIKKQQV
ncbi:molybdopterin-containing oxidoreductase family protein [Alteribacillus bidgolensis]|uniref:Anaerobic selenocysteine-containing dehydrogenase n=1 Tax=Alteribacillus bidgolensis TaxID=930129 RepID=A0A1G8K403_9BACI|nr:molybdopterin-dependent oxidoreductase [Alteribacillus bidgolensis]SDI38185.1 Anaerobic selenocysteine-containing dehydrogenase [Alteribacillus bidgolensis]